MAIPYRGKYFSFFACLAGIGEHGGFSRLVSPVGKIGFLLRHPCALVTRTALKQAILRDSFFAEGSPRSQNAFSSIRSIHRCRVISPRIRVRTKPVTNTKRIAPSAKIGLVQPWVQSEGSFLASAIPFIVRVTFIPFAPLRMAIS
jgi:hypothetical protein